ncbi:MAG: translation elongation factor EF-1 subunit alpha [Candidatus Hodarchaeota archaeon]
MSDKKPHINLIIIGHVDHGKSTLMGHMLYKTGALSKQEMAKLEKLAEEMDRGSFKFAYVMDRLKEERERGLTIDLAFRPFQTQKNYFTIIDAPGHADFIKNMITGASQADAAILVVSARKGEFEAGVGAGGQTREHAFLAKTLGIDQVVVAINKMDDSTPPWSEERYNEIKAEVSELLKGAQFDVSKVQFVPISGWTGDTLNEASTNMGWYKGPTLLDAIDQFILPPKPIEDPLRVPIQDVYTITGIGTVPVGRIETGVLKVGDKVIFMPPNKQGEIKTIEMHHERMDKAEPGDNIGFNVRGIGKGEIRRGDVMGHVNKPPRVVQEFVGQIIVLFHPRAIAAGYTPVLHAHTAQVAATITEIKSKLDPRTGEVVQENPDFIKQGDSAIVKLRPVQPLCLETYAQMKQLGRFAIRDSGRTVAVGVVREVTEERK